MRTYLILKEKGERWNADKEIQALVAETGPATPSVSKYSAKSRDRLLAQRFDRQAIASQGLAYERLDQLTIELLLGIK
jgi:xylose isomerase